MKKLILLVVLVLLVGLAVFVSASYSSSQKWIIIPIKNGWNLVPASSWELNLGLNSPVTFSDFKHGYAYNPFDGKYLLIRKNGKDIYGGDGKPTPDWVTSSWLKTASLWMYSDKDGNFLMKWDSSVSKPSSSDYELKNGYNLIWLTPEMVGKTIEELRGTCNIQKAYGWDTSQNNAYWNDLLDEKLPEEAVGMGFVIKVADDCTLSVSETISEEDIAPPTIPN